MTKVEKNNNTTQVEEEFSRLGFDYKHMKEKALYLGDSYVILSEIFRLNINSDLHYHDELHVQFGVNCAKKREPFSLCDMSTRLIRYSGSCYEGIELDYQFYDREFPAKDHIISEMHKKIKSHESKNQVNNAEISHDRVIHAKETLSAINRAEQISSVKTGKKIK